MANINININNQNTIKTKDFPKMKQCSDNKVLYRVTYGYQSKLSGEVIFPVTYENFNEEVRKTIPIIFPGNIVIYTPQFKEDVNYNRKAIVKKVTSQFAGREAQEKGMAVDPDKDKTTIYDLEFINPIVGRNGEIVKTKNNVKRLNKNGSVQLTKTQDEVMSYFCEESPVPYMLFRNYNNARNVDPMDAAAKQNLRNKEDALWNHNFETNTNLQPLYPKMSVIPDIVKTKLNKEVERMVKVGFLLGKKKQQPQIKKKKGQWVISFMMPGKSKPGDTITLPIVGKKYTINVVVQIPIVVGDDRHTPKVNEYLKDIPIDKQANTENYDKLEKLNAKSVDTEFNPTFIKASEYVGSESQKDTSMLVKPGEKQIYFINNASIIKQGDDNFSFKKLGLFDKEARTLVFDLYVIVALNLTYKYKAPEDPSKDTTAGKIKRKTYELLLNSGNDCPSYMTKIKQGAARLLSSISPENTIGAAVTKFQTKFLERKKIEKERASGRSGVRMGGGRKRTRKRCHKKASRTVTKCWKRKTKKGFKRCWKKGRKTYKRCKDWKKGEKKLKSCRRKKRTRRKQKGGYGLPYEHWYMEEIDN